MDKTTPHPRLLSATVDGQPVQVPEGTRVIQMLEQTGHEVPVFCYHPRLKVAGNCRMCLVEVAGQPKPVASCATPVTEGMAVLTQSPMVRTSREGALEFLLLNHPLDCPVCDQGGECDLQDLTQGYGPKGTRTREPRRRVPDKPMGPLIKTVMTRCIHCTRCIRFASDVAGVPELGAFGRGETMEVATMVGQAVTSELSGNLVDLCPVGALTSKPGAFRTRPWELESTGSIDVMDALGCHIHVDTRGGHVMRIRPRVCEDINQEWISDITRYACDALALQRLDHPWIRKRGKLVPCSWEQALEAVVRSLKRADPSRMAALAGDLVDAESLYVLGEIWKAKGSPHKDARTDSSCLTGEGPGAIRFNTTLAGLAQADFCVLVGVNPRWEAPVLNARIRQHVVQGKLHVAVVGPRYDLTFPYTWLGDHPRILETFTVPPGVTHPVVILGTQPLTRPDGPSVLALVHRWIRKAGGVRPDWNGFNILHRAASRVAALDLGWTPAAHGGLGMQGQIEAARQGKLDLVYLLGVDHPDVAAFRQPGITVIYQGHHGDEGAQVADIVLPGAAWTEKQGIYLNTEGRVQETRAAVAPPGQAREDRAVLVDLARRMGLEDMPQTREELLERLYAACPWWTLPLGTLPCKPLGRKGKVDDAPFEPALTDPYRPNVIARLSPSMNRCVAEILPLVPHGLVRGDA